MPKLINSIQHQFHMPSRRQLLCASGLALGATFAGCSAVPVPRPKLDFAIDNARSTTVPVDIRFFRPDIAERSEALVYQNTVEVPPRDNPDDLWQVMDVAPDRRYRIKLLVGSPSKSHHYHYHPDCSDDNPYDIGAVANLLQGGGVRFTQTTCSDDEPFL
ncbi:hypothetical protein HLASF_1129 [Halanaeroarchaeum sulfurireducens]|uniref:Uncharacterized protein n=1 Tax=Halanaeroarchaeum sulfurireducens TaxID=1604004 RepID=A0A0F7PA05_9EURY|nr:hypothetical protein HLASF_1129 [Halanaeroarchaeum sulfurireducens]ALG82013.1 hypothetical protein HLASA_1118 [Halanaeroarchaeum sulfurireducens]